MATITNEVVRLKQHRKPPGNHIAQAALRGLDIITATLLLTGQITLGGIFVAPSDFALSLSGPFTGSGAVGITKNAQFVQDGVDIITALLLIIDEINVIGTYVTSDRFTIVVGGPPFGSAKTEAYAPRAREFFRDYSELVMSRYNYRRKRK